MQGSPGSCVLDDRSCLSAWEQVILKECWDFSYDGLHRKSFYFKKYLGQYVCILKMILHTKELLFLNEKPFSCSQIHCPEIMQLMDVSDCLGTEYFSIFPSCTFFFLLLYS